VLIIDEAQNMPPDTLEELRLLSNLNADQDQLIQIVLVGQAGLRETLRQPELAQFAQRIAVDYHLSPLEAAETRSYIRHRISVAAGEERDLFDDAAHQAVYAATKGVPRLINLLCDTALVYGYAEQQRLIDVRIVHEVASDKKKNGALSLADDGPPRQMTGASTIERASSVLRKSRANTELTADPIPLRDPVKGA
jgi:type II secretory pathway predicted ATPase ExeA